MAYKEYHNPSLILNTERFQLLERRKLFTGGRWRNKNAAWQRWFRRLLHPAEKAGWSNDGF